ncbi:hypothetical protein RHGRI_000485 [Rhododendron griersonianum]|uniref:Bifunctional inhibitor/plant lipid transfer protein/seed storage helical domain-containing protein n=1 Tax=Rhododendron griersonianum TaxID=479676 RepID=A0AAV6KRF5_9ERIC|nr:hypothetical protein RHGRI_025262 [Rhododendron griersonianum]KAG5551169.1 hypothetical protein RHGRI_009560 [Rhododendron griersonianum]KAG5554990.1 hypothetical protein RHGRI_012512 [Rhododendron griersonianum]KAG5564300.1 hypothetical protein RHGRI_000485 [Rhododendron griersonianum]
MDTRTNGYFTNLMQSGSNEEQFMESQYFNPNVQVAAQETQFTAAMGSISKKQRSGNFTVEEDKLLVSAWLNISMDAIQGCGAYPFCGLAAVAAAVLWGGAAAQSSSSSCTSELISMSPCLNYITGNSSEPSSSCCQQLASVVKSQPQCLCAALNGGGSSMGINVNQNQALALHAACSVTTPPISRCSGKNPFPRFC